MRIGLTQEIAKYECLNRDLVLATIPLVYRSIATVRNANDVNSWNNALKLVGILQISFGTLLTVGLLL